MQYYRLLLGLALFFCSTKRTSAIWQPFSQHITMQNGLPGNVVYDIYEDSKGFMWFCTDQGISRYDGTNFHNYSINEGIPDMAVFRIREDKAQRYWLICYNQKACYLKNGKVYSAENDALCRKIEAEDIAYNELFTDRDGNDCLTGKKVAVLSSGPPYLRVLPGITLFKGRTDNFLKNGQDHIVTGAGVCNINSGSFQKFSLGFAETSFYDGHSLFTSGVGSPVKQQTLEQWQFEAGGLRLLRQVSVAGRIYQISASETGLRLCTAGGIMLYDTLSRKITPDTAFPAGIPVNCMRVDREGNRWLGTLNDGIYFMPVNGGRMIDRSSGLVKNNILSVTQGENGDILAGDDAGHVYRVMSDKIQVYTLDQQINNRVMFLRDNGRGAWIAGTDFGLYTISTTGMPCLLFGNAMKAGLIAGHNIYVGTHSGLKVYDRHTGKSSNVLDSRVTALALDNNQTLWTGSINGLSYFRNGKSVKYDQDRLPANCYITSMVPAPDGGIIAGTSTQGLFFIKDSWSAPLHMNKRYGMSSNNCKQLFVSGNGYIWVCSDMGLERIWQQADGHFTVKTFPLPQGIVGKQINDLMEHGGTLYLATVQGILILDSQDTMQFKPPRLYIESINGTAPAGQTLRFNYQQRNLQVAFTGLSYTGGTPLQYKYLLSGGSADTLYTSAQTIDFTALSPGAYTLLIWCRSPGSAWTLKPVRLSFTILPPFWHHPAIILGGVLLTGIAVALLFRFRIRKIKKRIALETGMQQQLAALEMQALRAQINPHFIFNALNAIQFYYSQNDEMTANHYMTSFAHFIRLTLTHSQAHWLPLSEEIAMLRTYVELEQIRFRHLFSVDFEIAPDLAAQQIAIPAMLIQPYVENAINHGLRYLKKRPGKLRLSFRLQQNKLYCVIDDNGIGRRQAAAYRQAQHTSMGTKITHQRIEAINRMYGITIQVGITDKPDTPDGPGGTQVSLCTPLKLIDHDLNNTDC